jgi:hypothetical protein
MDNFALQTARLLIAAGYIHPDEGGEGPSEVEE